MEAGAGPRRIIWVEELVQRNEELIAAVAENQALNRVADAAALQEALQKNLLALCQYIDLAREVAVDDDDAAESDGTDDLVDRLIVEVPCAECKRIRNSGERCRKRLRHTGANWDYRPSSKEDGVDGVTWHMGPEDQAAAFHEFQRRRREAEAREAGEAETRKKSDQLEHESQLRTLEQIRKKHELNETAQLAQIRGRKRWSDEEHDRCLEGVKEHGPKAFKLIAAMLQSRTAERGPAFRSTHAGRGCNGGRPARAGRRARWTPNTRRERRASGPPRQRL